MGYSRNRRKNRKSRPTELEVLIEVIRTRSGKINSKTIVSSLKVMKKTQMTNPQTTVQEEANEQLTEEVRVRGSTNQTLR
jgi:hypothetical protein